MEERIFQHQNLQIVVKTGTKKPALDENVLTIYTHSGNQDCYLKADISLDPEIVQVGIADYNSGDFHYKTYYYVLDEGEWNYRFFKDVSIKRNLNRIKPQVVSRKDRHAVTLHFGRSKMGKEMLLEFMKKLAENQFIVDYGQEVRFRNWNQKEEILLSLKKTQVTLNITSEKFNSLIALIQHFHWEEAAVSLKKVRTRSIFERVECNIELQDYFKKPAKPTSESSVK